MSCSEQCCSVHASQWCDASSFRSSPASMSAGVYVRERAKRSVAASAEDVIVTSQIDCTVLTCACCIGSSEKCLKVAAVADRLYMHVSIHGTAVVLDADPCYPESSYVYGSRAHTCWQVYPTKAFRVSFRLLLQIKAYRHVNTNSTRHETAPSLVSAAPTVVQLSRCGVGIIAE